MRQTIQLNREWLYRAQDVIGGQKAECNEEAFEAVCLPHSNVTLPWHDFDDKEYQFVSWYRRHLAVPRVWRGKRLHLIFDGVMIAAQVWVNGTFVGEHKGGYTPFTLDITEAVGFGKKNVIAVRVDSSERRDIPPCGGLIDYLTFGGIYRDVSLSVLDQIHIADVAARPNKRSLTVSVSVANEDGQARRTTVTAKIAGKTVKHAFVAAPHERCALFLTFSGLTVKPWSLDKPHLYDLKVSISNGDAVTTRVGFREARFEKDGKFYLNGKHVQLRGLNRHQTFPFVGGAMPARVHRRDADILKYELGLNMVRTSHYPQSSHFLDRCDEIGLLVLEEIPGWTHIGDEAWKEVSKQELREMVLRDRNHPSIVLWGVRINESKDDHGFYTATNQLAHELDPTRQTCGVRNFRDSEFLEDVFTYNDFSNGVLTPNHRPYLITEFNGHMYPAKPFDPEDRMVEHALRHARIQDAQIGTPGVAGAIGWCAFDYNTHGVFGSGDRMCYHGVMDIFRFPKFAGHFYKSQQEPKTAIVLEPATVMKQGERDGGGVAEVIVFSNCEEVAVLKNGKEEKTCRPDRATFPHLAHAPFRLERPQEWPWTGSVEIIGKIKGKIVARRKMACDGVPYKLRVTADDESLTADGSDCTRLAFALTDRYGNILPYATGVVRFAVDGPASLIGENPFALVAGRGALWLRAGQKKGKVVVTAQLARHKDQQVMVRLT